MVTTVLISLRLKRKKTILPFYLNYLTIFKKGDMCLRGGTRKDVERKDEKGDG